MPAAAEPAGSQPSSVAAKKMPKRRPDAVPPQIDLGAIDLLSDDDAKSASASPETRGDTAKSTPKDEGMPDIQEDVNMRSPTPSPPTPAPPAPAPPPPAPAPRTPDEEADYSPVPDFDRSPTAAPPTPDDAVEANVGSQPSDAAARGLLPLGPEERQALVDFITQMKKRKLEELKAKVTPSAFECIEKVYALEKNRR